jgi:hypothetical protein
MAARISRPRPEAVSQMLYGKPVGSVSSDAKFDMCRQRLEPIKGSIRKNRSWLCGDPDLVTIPIGHSRQPDVIDRPHDVWNGPGFVREAASWHKSAKETLKDIGIAGRGIDCPWWVHQTE